MMPNSLHGKSILLGISGSISSYKAIDLASKLVQHGADLDVIMTSSAARFVAPLTFENIIHKPVVQDVFTSESEKGIYHISATERADLVVVAPATANMIAKISNGLCDDPVSLAVLSSKAPVVICPAMDGHMYQNLATQENIRKLTDRGIYLVGPTTGRLASGSIGQGRLVEPSDILSHIRLLLGQTGDLAGRKIVVSAGGTQEPIDPIRFLGNRSSGKMGYALAEAAIDRGANTVIVAAPNNLIPPAGTKILKVVTAKEMHSAIVNEMEDCDILIMSAAVADWRPKETAKNKIKKNDLKNLSITIKKNEDIIANIKKPNLVKVGFAAETENMLSQARQKLKEKNLDLIAANNVSGDNTGFGSDNNEVVLIDREGNVNELGLLSKYEIGQHILNAVVPMLKPK
jgi:phosphopantothenoylcysteine decarboxylase/phosphopantothenate--cysteine ligase